MGLLTQLPGLYILDDPIRGRGVHTTELIRKGSVIEVCPVIVLNELETQLVDKTILYDYYFVWDIEAKEIAMALGYGSLYNHSSEPNAEFTIYADSREIQFIALRDIEPGSEINISYIPKEDQVHELWFNPV